MEAGAAGGRQREQGEVRAPGTLEGGKDVRHGRIRDGAGRPAGLPPPLSTGSTPEGSGLQMEQSGHPREGRERDEKQARATETSWKEVIRQAAGASGGGQADEERRRVQDESETRLGRTDRGQWSV